MERLDLNNLTKKAYHVGNLNRRVIDLLSLNIGESEILLGVDKIQYIEKHKHKFRSDAEYERHVERTPDIIACPDFVALHPDGQSIQYIKTIDETMLVAVRIRASGVMWVKSIYPITKDKLKLYIDAGTAKEVSSAVDK